MINFLRLFCFFGIKTSGTKPTVFSFYLISLIFSHFIFSPILAIAQISKSTEAKALSQTEAKTSQKASLRLVVIGDSLVEGYGVARDQAFPSLLEKKLKETDPRWTVVNSGISGSTSGSALARVRWQLKEPPDLLMIVLGANDGLRGLSVSNMKENLRKGIQAALDKKIPVILAGMQMPPNYSKDYREPFAQAFKELGKMEGVTLIPFLLEGVAGESSLNLADGIHPNEQGQKKIAETVFRVILPLAKSVTQKNL